MRYRNTAKYMAILKSYSDELFVETVEDFEKMALPIILQENYSLHSAFQVMKCHEVYRS